MSTFPTKHPGETFAIEVDFSRYSVALDSAIVAVRVQSGVDSTPEDLVIGSVQLVGGKVRQRVRGGVAGVRYIVQVTASAGADTWVHEVVLPVAALS